VGFCIGWWLGLVIGWLDGGFSIIEGSFSESCPGFAE